MNIDIEAKSNEALAALFKHFYEEKTNLIYEFRDPDRQKNLPTAEEITAEIPYPTGWAGGMEDCAIAGGAVLQGLIREYRQTGSPLAAERIRSVWAGLKRLGTTGPRGFVCRGLNLTDSRSYYPNSSQDQYKLYCSGLLQFLSCDLCAAEDRSFIADVAAGIVERVMRAGMRIPRADNRPEILGDVGLDAEQAGEKIRVSRADVLLYHALAAVAAGTEQWRGDYERLRDAHGRLALKKGVLETWTVENVKKSQVYICMQGAYLFRALYDFETEPEAKAVYRTALKNIANAAAPRLDQYQPDDPGGYFGAKWNCDWRRLYRVFMDVNPRFASDPKLKADSAFAYFVRHGRPSWLVELRNVSEPFEALLAVMLSEEHDLIRAVKEKAVRMLSTLPVEKLQYSGSMFDIASIVWRGRELECW